MHVVSLIIYRFMHASPSNNLPYTTKDIDEFINAGGGGGHPATVQPTCEDDADGGRWDHLGRR